MSGFVKINISPNVPTRAKVRSAIPFFQYSKFYILKNSFSSKCGVHTPPLGRPFIPRYGQIFTRPFNFPCLERISLDFGITLQTYLHAFNEGAQLFFF